jgi:ATP-binding cassette subfamily A (ABC1) protein 3
LIVCCFIIGLIGAYQRDHYATAAELGTLMAICSFYSFAMLPFIYAFSYLFSKHSTGETYLSLISLLLGLLFGVYQLLKYSVENVMFKGLIGSLYWVGLLLAPFSLTEALVKLGFSFLNQKSIFTFDRDTGIGINIVFNVLSGFLFLGFCILKDHLVFEWIYYKYLNRPRALPLLSENLDSDVNAEIQKVKEMSMDDVKNSNLVLKGVSKYYNNLLAVNQLYLDVESCECFGLLGINGAGKTTTFKMMTGDELITAGDAFIRGFSMKSDLEKVHRLIGYTPQYDALIPELTGNETLKIFSLIRGIPKYEINQNINRMSSEMGFQQHLGKQIKAFSGGNKRKMSTCLALLGYPQLIFLDEPTTGIDPQAKRQLWDVITKTRNSGRAIVITSHSMEECENLCTKIGIMVNGQFKCLGSVQYLKNKYSKGFVLTIKMGKDDTDFQIEIQNRVLEAFPSAELKEKYLDILTFHIDSTNLQWSQVFGICGQMKKAINISDYSLCQMSLEQVFLLFSKSGIYQNV